MTATPPPPGPTADLPDVDPGAVGEDLLLDVREREEWAAGHAPGAMHVPLSELAARWAEVPTDRPVAVVCKAGARSAQATVFLQGQGRQVRNVTGGMLAWRARGLPMTTDNGQPPTVA